MQMVSNGEELHEMSFFFFFFFFFFVLWVGGMIIIKIITNLTSAELAKRAVGLKVTVLSTSFRKLFFAWRFTQKK